MLDDIGAQHVYLACGNTDLHKSIDGLAAIVSHSFKLDPFSPCLFVFCNRRRDKLKILRWEHNGFGCTIADSSVDGSSGQMRPLLPLRRSVSVSCDGSWMVSLYTNGKLIRR